MIDKVKKLASEYESPLGNIEIECAAVASINDIEFAKYDVVLLAPQVRNYLAQVKEKCEPFNIPVEFIDIVAYGMGDARMVIEQMETMYGKNN